MENFRDTLSMLAIVLLMTVARPARAEDSMSLGEPVTIPNMTQVWGPWELQLYWGYIIPTKKGTFSHDVPNNKVFDLIAGEGTLDETSEGFVLPPIPGNSTVADTLKNFSEVGIALLYQTTPWLQVGGQFGYGLKRNPYIDNVGIYSSSNFLKVNFEANIYHLNAPFQVGSWFGPIKPHLSLAPGVYFVEDNVRAAFDDSDDPQLKQQLIFSQRYIYMGASAGAGIDVRIGDNGRLSLGCEYHKVFAPMGKLDFLLPRATLGVSF